MISVFLIILAAIFNAVMDVLSYRFNKSIFRYWKNQNWINPSISWKNKWEPKSKLGDFIMSTILVFLTDMWHFAKMLMIVSIILAIVFYTPICNLWIDIFIFYFSFTAVFELFFSKIFIKE